MLSWPLLPKAHQTTYGGGRRIENAHFILLDNAPDTIWLRIGRGSLKHHTGHTGHQWTIDDIAMPGDPANISRTPIDIIGLDIEDKLRSRIDPNTVTAMNMHHAFRFPGTAASIENIEDIFGVHLLARDFGIFRNI